MNILGIIRPRIAPSIQMMRVQVTCRLVYHGQLISGSAPPLSNPEPYRHRRQPQKGNDQYRISNDFSCWYFLMRRHRSSGLSGRCGDIYFLPETRITGITGHIRCVYHRAPSFAGLFAVIRSLITPLCKKSKFLYSNFLKNI